MTSFSEMITIDPRQGVEIDRWRDVNEKAIENLVEEVQTRLRGSADFGVDPRAAVRAQAIRVAAEGNRLIIDESDQNAVLGVTGRHTDHTTAMDAGELFEQSSGVPALDSGNKLVFRSISVDNLFADNSQERLNESVERSVRSTVREGLVDAYDRAITSVRQRHPLNP